MKYTGPFIIILIFNFMSLLAQTSSLSAEIELQSGYNGPGQVPFWFRANQFGSIPPEGLFASLIASGRKEYDQPSEKLVDWGFSAEGRFNLGDPSDVLLIEGYGKFRLSVFELKVGRSKDIMGLCDTSLTSGSYIVSGSSLAIPKIELSMPEFYVIPFLGRIFAVKGNFVHAWMGNTHKGFDTIAIVSPTYLHQKSFYGRFGKPEWKLKLYGGFNHQVVWGDEASFMGEDYTLNDWQTFWYVISGKRYNNGTILGTRIGNHLGTIDLGLMYDFKKFRLFIYRQSIYDAGALYYFANIIDGLNGLSITNTYKTENKFQWHKFVVEVLYTKNQGGEVWSYKPSHLYYENYFNNGYYREGWSYRDKSIGTAFISPGGTIREELPVAPNEYFVNNRVIAFHFGFEANISNLIIRSKVTYSQNYGTYRTAAEGHEDIGLIFPSPFGVFPVTNQFSGLLEGSKELKKGFTLGLRAAVDIGELYEDTFGFICSVMKVF